MCRPRLRHGMEDLEGEVEEEGEEEEEEADDGLVGFDMFELGEDKLPFPELGQKAGILEAGKARKACLLSPSAVIELPLACKQRCRKTWNVK